MAIKVEFIGYLRSAWTERNEKLNKDLLHFTVEKMAPINEENEKVGKDVTYKITSFNSEKFPVSSLRPFKDKKVVVSCYLNSNQYDNKNTGQKDYILGLNMTNIISWEQYQRNQEQAKQRESFKAEGQKQPAIPADALPGEYNTGQYTANGQTSRSQTPVLPSGDDADDLPF